MRIVRYLLIIGVMWAGRMQAFPWAVLSMLGSYLSSAFVVNKALDKGNDRGDQLTGGTVITKTGAISTTGPSFVGCTITHGQPAAPAAAAPLLAPPASVAGKIDVDTYVNRFSAYCSTKVNTGCSWLYDHKLRVAGISIAIIYGYTLARIIVLQNFMRAHYSWGAWHEGCDWNNLSPKESADLREELLVEVRRRYPKNDDLVPVHSFMYDLEKEVAVYNNYLTLVERIKQAYRYECCITDRFKDAYVGLLGNTVNAQVQGAWIFDWFSIKRWLCLDEQSLVTCVRRREHVLHLKAFYAEWLTTVRAIYKQSK